MQHIDQTPPEIQKDLLRALIENITVYEDRIVMNMFIEAESLPQILLNACEKEKNLTPTISQDEVSDQSEHPVASTASVSNWRQSKGG
jgi:MoxR-like ATPase